MNLSKYNGLTRCIADKWEEQQECSYAEKSDKRDCCCWMRFDGTCSNPDISKED